MSLSGRSPSLPRHRSWNLSGSFATLYSFKGSLSSPAVPTVTSSPPELQKHSDGQESKKNKGYRRRSRKAVVFPLLLLLVFFFLEWRYLASLGHGTLSTSERPRSPSPASVQSERFDGSSRPVFERLMGLAAHALAEQESNPEPDDLWSEPMEGSSNWSPCANQRHPGHVAPPAPEHSSGYIMVNADGGLNQQRVAICNAVAVARLLNATLVVPQFLFSSFWRDSSQFGDIYEEKFFQDYLKDDVHIVPELPSDLQSLNLRAMGSILTNADVPKESMPSFFVNNVLPILIQNRVVYFNGFANALTFDPIPFDIQRLRCRCNYHALKFKSHIKETAGLMIRRMRDKNLRWGPSINLSSTIRRLSTIEKELVDYDGISESRQADAHIRFNEDSVKENATAAVRYLGLHLRFEMDMVAYSLCEFGGGDAERQELAKFREIHFPTLSKYQQRGKLTSAAKLREEGKCPLTPEEAVLMLASLGFKRSTRIFLAGAHIYGGQARMATISNLYPNLVTKEDLLTNEELAPFVNHTSQMAALDFIGCAAADAFAMTDSGSQLSSLASGYRIYYGEGQHPTIIPNKRRLALIFTKNMTIEWEVFEERVRKLVRESKRLLVRPFARSIYRQPRCRECMCH